MVNVVLGVARGSGMTEHDVKAHGLHPFQYLSQQQQQSQQTQGCTLINSPNSVCSQGQQSNQGTNGMDKQQNSSDRNIRLQ
ncbi:MAG: hypothetical protein WAM14_11540 [Candidatus Nitrosopolaris sp.]